MNRVDVSLIRELVFHRNIFEASSSSHKKVSNALTRDKSTCRSTSPSNIACFFSKCVHLSAFYLTLKSLSRWCDK